MNLWRTTKYTFIAFIIAVALLSALGYTYLRSAGFFREPQYDLVAPPLPELTRPAILVLDKTNGFIHKEGLPAASQMLQKISESNGWSVYQTDNAATHAPEYLDKFDVVVWNNTSGDLLTVDQREAFKTWIEAGGSWLGLHAAGGDRNYDWGWYRDHILRAQFFGHTMSPQFQDAEVLKVDDSELTSHLPLPWLVVDEEWYAFENNPREQDSLILLALDESSYDTGEIFFAEPTMPGEHPIAWTHKVKSGSVVYSAIGHQAHTYQNQNYIRFVEKSLHSLIKANAHD